MLQRLRHRAISPEDIQLLQSRILSPHAFTNECKWRNAPLITSRNLVRCMHNKQALLSLAANLHVQALSFVAIDTFQKGVSLDAYPRLRSIIEDLSDSVTASMMTEFMYLYYLLN